jgi:flagellar basal body-associated protein FliL
MHDTNLPRTEAEFVAYERTHKQHALGRLLQGIGIVIFAVAVLLYVLWLMLASVKATAFDADGVRCYGRAMQIACIKTAEPAR